MGEKWKRSDKKLRKMLIRLIKDQKGMKKLNNTRCLYFQRDWKFRFSFFLVLFTKCKIQVNDTLTRQLIFFRVLSDIKIFCSKLKYSIARDVFRDNFLFILRLPDLFFLLYLSSFTSSFKIKEIVLDVISLFSKTTCTRRMFVDQLNLKFLGILIVI